MLFYIKTLSIYIACIIIFDYCCYVQSAIIISLQNKGPGSEKIMDSVSWKSTLSWGSGVLFLIGAVILIFSLLDYSTELYGFVSAMAALLYAIIKYRTVTNELRK
jgi:hypothetical protein